MKKWLKKIWKDSVFSRLIAEAIKWLWIAVAAPILLGLWAFVKALVAKIDLQSAWIQTTDGARNIVNQTINASVLTLLAFVVGYFLLTFLIRRLLASRKTSKIKSYNTDTFWAAIIRWKWEKKDDKLRVKYDDYELVCPNSRHNLVHDQLAGDYFLRCNQCGFVSRPYHHEPPTAAIILAPMSDLYFYTALTSEIDSELRRRGLK